MDWLLMIIKQMSYRINFGEAKQHTKQLMLRSQRKFQGWCARHNYRVVPIAFHRKQRRLWNSKSSSKVPDGSTLEKRDQLHSFSNVAMVPLLGSPTPVLLGTRAKLTNVWVLEIFKCERPNPSKCSLTHMKVPRDNRYCPLRKSLFITMIFELTQEPGNNSLPYFTS